MFNLGIVEYEEWQPTPEVDLITICHGCGCQVTIYKDGEIANETLHYICDYHFSGHLDS